jgi:hypothetical protein
MSNPLDSITTADLIPYIKNLNAKTEAEKKSVASLQAEVSALTGDLVPNGIKDISKIIWPYQMSSGMLLTSPSRKTNGNNIQNSNRAGFVINKIQATIFEITSADGDPLVTKYIDLQSNIDLIHDLYVRFSNSSDRYFSSKFFHISHLGNARFFTRMISNPFIQPNTNFTVELSSKSSTKKYMTNISLLGYRLDIENGENILSYQSID